MYQEIFTYHNDTACKAEFAYNVVDKIYNAFRQWYFTIIFCDFTYFENRILKYTETKDYGYPVMLLSGCASSASTKVKPKIAKHGATAYIITSEELSLEVNDDVIGALIRTGVFKPRSPLIFVINLPVDVDSYFYYDMQRHFQLLWSRSITNSVLIVWNEKLRMYTYNAFLNEVKDITDEKNVGSYLSRQYYNLNGHQLRLSVFRQVYLSNETGPVKCQSILAKTVMSSLNASCLPLMPRDGSTVGDLLDNGTATGVTGDLIDGYTDLELSSRILKTTYYGYIDTTYPLTNDELCFLVKKAEKQSTFTSVLQLISSNILMLFLSNVVILITIAMIARKLETHILGQNQQTNGSPLMDLVKCFLKQTADIKFLGPVFRFLIFMIISYSLVINSVIDGIIYSAITYPRYKSDINTLKQLYETNLTFGVHNRHMNIYKSSLTEHNNEITLKRTEAFNDKKIKEVLENRKFEYAILLRKTEAQHISRNPSNMAKGKPIFHTVLQCPIPCSIVYGLRYGSPYLPRINYILHHLNQGGILQYWSKSDELGVNTHFDKLLINANNKDRKALGINNLKEVFYVWLFGLLLSCFAFLFEILWRAVVVIELEIQVSVDAIL
ncbi:uncharacterized protein LOC113229809 [Hyposmocoma kahamanoa]|uniref:uncharacterized protein LOC113229809 n=1 Tax=Hyposmocoma kahamanoa TaxID=1477025 RepID=UPI000E6D6BBC|nr:uncharacterized protein LOC113229809 [Hyposmocoma kahamanoa]